MDAKSLEVISGQLQEQREKISARADKLRAELSGLDEDLSRVEAALSVLSGAPLPATKAPGAKKERKKAAAPSAKKAKVSELIAAVLSQTTSLDESELKALVEQKLVESGHNRNGYSLRFQEALSDTRFHKGPNGVSLKQPALRT